MKLLLYIIEARGSPLCLPQVRRTAFPRFQSQRLCQIVGRSVVSQEGFRGEQNVQAVEKYLHSGMFSGTQALRLTAVNNSRTGIRLSPPALAACPGSGAMS